MQKQAEEREKQTKNNMKRTGMNMQHQFMPGGAHNKGRRGFTWGGELEDEPQNAEEAEPQEEQTGAEKSDEEQIEEQATGEKSG